MAELCQTAGLARAVLSSGREKHESNRPHPRLPVKTTTVPPWNHWGSKEFLHFWRTDQGGRRNAISTDFSSRVHVGGGCLNLFICLSFDSRKIILIWILNKRVDCMHLIGSCIRICWEFFIYFFCRSINYEQLFFNVGKNGLLFVSTLIKCV